ncbi:glucose-6-phosphate dehydrogenase [Gluconobacter oxydans]|uniref:Glucose-6-phosphate 1-dehydrogenase n=2 Tax=Gluconobacter oxydans TaxID=442 RepID=G6PD_GLUOX|nr:glucose-6-phosphate dehydrogenase [Gluconobacter oxydans]Q5FUK8.1 RecName: Full=Glucose-6-phosphate 1-dehydrogenase; Short=G6PD; Short=G6PDH [Gluconobacter oxydans 621H]AAW59938.1 Glucose-6-phosphate 1-dehydrogenase [Gluconobacter oxydans 621H]KXV30503.1 glucose-6-phosphate dehydrogenase [Gluconobacter oxydans]MBF0855125.1 glucose-6-phosphate dehydrogenase [Gluconobacter oxydans]TCW29311.1 glucose-6-phosphate 1-dehydrogenase [Gluconobacter oxydans]GEC60895.1 glucose-6-phosphate 1-dehydroge
MEHFQQVEPFDYVIFGATGDLTMRKLLPALYNRLRMGQIPDDACIIGAARTELDREAYVARARDALERFLPSDILGPGLVERFLARLDYVTLDSSREGPQWDALKSLLAKAQPDRVRVYYFATAPQLYGSICENLNRYELITPTSRVVLEKPIGTNMATATAINDGVGQYFPEKQIYRIDHYLGKETVQNVLALRFANPLMNAAWSGEHIESVQITAVETVGVEGRAAYYDTSGALRDMIQNHLLQVLCLVAMEAPDSLEADAVRNAKLAVLNALRPITDATAATETVRAQYTAGVVDGENVPGYLEELGKPSATETYAAIRAWVDTPRWKNVPFYIRTAKRSGKKVSEIVVTFRPAATTMFGATPASNRLVLRIQPNEGVDLRLNVKNPALDVFNLRTADLDTSIRMEGGLPFPDSYERLLLDAVRGDPVLFIRRDEVEAAWRWVEPILEAWKHDKAPMQTYSAGSYGPEQATQLLASHGDTWHEASE